MQVLRFNEVCSYRVSVKMAIIKVRDKGVREFIEVNLEVVGV
jgi:hypothetical protein